MCGLFLLEQYVNDFQRFDHQSPQVQGELTMGIFADYSKTQNAGELNNTMQILEDWLSNNFIISTYFLDAKNTLKQMMSRVSAKITSTIAPDKCKWKSVR